jgi:hypothetical protein
MNYVFVDFENVQDINLAVPMDKPMSLVLLIGEKQKTIGVDLVEQLFARSANVQLVRLAASGKNALDFVLAYHVGRAMAADAGAYFHIVSKDKGFDALVKHLKTQGHRIARYDAFAELPFLTAAKGGAKTVEKSVPQTAEGAGKVGEFIAALQRNPANRPKKEKTLRAHLRSHMGRDLSDDEAGKLFDDLVKRAGITIDAKGGVSYRFADKGA